MKSKQVCEHCGSTISPYKVHVTEMMVRALIKFRQAVNDKGVNSVHLVNDMENKPYALNRFEWNNFTRLRFLGLAVKDDDNKSHWLLTHRGVAFLGGRQAIPEYVTVLHNRIIDRSENLIFVKDVIGSTPYLEKIDDIEYVHTQERLV